MFGIVVNYFSRPNHPPSIRQSAVFALSLLKNCSEVTSIVLVDGSGESDLEMENACASLGAKYCHFGRMLSFGEAYNKGAELLTEAWIVTMASDIYVYPDTFLRFRKFIEAHPQAPVGCLIPYLSACDYPVQLSHQSSRRVNCDAGVMTYNLNVFPRDVFWKLGGLSESYTGCYNDVDTSIKIKKLKLRVFLVDTFALHYGRLTLVYGSNADWNTDAAAFFQDYPELKSESYLWNIDLNYFLRSPLLKFVFSVANAIRPRRLRTPLMIWILRSIPRLQKI